MSSHHVERRGEAGEALSLGGGGHGIGFDQREFDRRVERREQRFGEGAGAGADLDDPKR